MPAATTLARALLVQLGRALTMEAKRSSCIVSNASTTGSLALANGLYLSLIRNRLKLCEESRFGPGMPANLLFIDGF